MDTALLKLLVQLLQLVDDGVILLLGEVDGLLLGQLGHHGEHTGGHSAGQGGGAAAANGGVVGIGDLVQNFVNLGIHWNYPLSYHADLDMRWINEKGTKKALQVRGQGQQRPDPLAGAREKRKLFNCRVLVKLHSVPYGQTISDFGGIFK